MCIFSRCTRAANSVVGGRVCPKFKLIQDFRVFLVSSKNEKDPIKMKANEWSQYLSHCMGVFHMYKGS